MRAPRSAPAVHPARRARRWPHEVWQAAIVLAALALLGWVFWTIRAALARKGIAFDMGFLAHAAGFSISEGWTITRHGLAAVDSGHSNAQALLAALGNTLKVALLAIAASTVLGTALGIARLSGNWLLRQMAFVLVELVRNTPLLIQLVFWYFAVVLKLPALHDAALWLGALLVSQQGIFLPGVALAAGTSTAAVAALLAALLLGAAAWHWPRARLLLGFAAALALLAAWLAGFPLRLALPQVDGFVVHAAITLSPEFAAMLLGLGLYAAAFIAEIVRGAMLALPAGQWQACAALGLRRLDTLRCVILPQVWRIVLPALGNQYISLGKNTSLGIAIGYPDLFNVYGTVANQSGRTLEGVLVAMLAYLLLSWCISALVNRANRRGGRTESRA